MIAVCWVVVVVTTIREGEMREHFSVLFPAEKPVISTSNTIPDDLAYKFTTPGQSHRGGGVLLGQLLLPAGLIWLIGRAIKYVLAGR